MKKILITCALPYANGPLHIGHMLEYIQADIWVRFKKMIGNYNKIYFICADDAHGTAIMLKSKKLKIKPEEIINKTFKEHTKSLKNFKINFDNYYTTHSNENNLMLSLVFNRLKKKKLIKNYYIYQLYDVKKSMFLPDRFVKGTCPKCFSHNQYGDNCENCGTVYSSKDLINPISLLSNSSPIIRKSSHFFFDLPFFTKSLENWIKSGTLQQSVYNKVKEWFKLGLKDWNISRDAPYFGFKIPNCSNKYFYVWLDATVGYMSTFKNLCNKNQNKSEFDDFWRKNSKAKIYQFIGKDIIYFHSLFWPAILEASNFRQPSKLFVHGHVQINGKKMSKSRENFITADSWLKSLDSDSLRYYYATKISSDINDIDLNIEDFVNKVNSDIVNKIINLASRNAKFINGNFFNILSSNLENRNLYNKFLSFAELIKKKFNDCQYHEVTKQVILLTDLANKYIDEKAPWKLIKQEKKNKTLLHDICSMGINLFRVIMTYLKPILPSLTNKVETFLKTELTWEGIKYPLLNHKISVFKKLYNRIDIKKIHFYKKIIN